MSSFLKLPTELASELVGQWLCLKDVARLDSAFGHNEMRNVLHESVFQSPLCIVAIAHQRLSKALAIFKWVSMKCIRLSTLHVKNGVEIDKCEDYLKRFGGTVYGVALSYCQGDCTLPLTLVARYCTNLRALDMLYCDLNLSIDILKSCVRLRSIDITSEHQSRHFVHWDSQATHNLHISSIKLHCSSRDEKGILGMCDPLCVQRLQLSNMTHTEWHTYVNLRSFGFRYNSFIHDANLLTHICTQCPWIVNLDVSGFGPLTDEIIVPALQVLQKLCTFNCQYQVKLTNHVLHTLIEHQKNTLEAVYVYGCASVSTSAKSLVLKECAKLHTLSCKVQDDLDYSLISNLTTLIMNFPSVEVWNGVQQHCHSLQHLHLVPQHGIAVDSHVIVGESYMQALRTVYTVRLYVHDLRLQLPSICVVDEACGKWYDLFELPI